MRSKPTGRPGVPDVIGPGLRVLFCGINPGTVSGALGQHFARPGNRFWKALHCSGFTERLLVPAEQDHLLGYGLGITNLVTATTAAASEVPADALRAGVATLEDKVARWEPAFVAFLGIGAYRTAFARPKAVLGRQPELVAGARIWLAPNPSGLQARYQLPEMAALFTSLRMAADRVRAASLAPDHRSP